MVETEAKKPQFKIGYRAERRKSPTMLTSLLLNRKPAQGRTLQGKLIQIHQTQRTFSETFLDTEEVGKTIKASSVWLHSHRKPAILLKHLVFAYQHIWRDPPKKPGVESLFFKYFNKNSAQEENLKNNILPIVCSELNTL